MNPRVLILSGYGINCERETQHAFQLAGGQADIVHVNDIILGEKSLSDYQILAFPGGFSYGDDTGSGNAMANKIRLNLFPDLIKFIKSGKLIIGICNGFQILVNLGLLPALGKEYGERQVALTYNDSARYECRWVHLKKQSNNCVFTKGLDKLHIPVAHGEGKFFASPAVLKLLRDNDQIAFTYTLSDGTAARGSFPDNPNGSLWDIGGICDKSGKILGMMPHPERAILMANAPEFQKLKENLKRQREEIPVYYEPALMIFKNAVEHIKQNPIRSITSYSDAGVNIELGDDASKILYNAAKQTWQNRKDLLGEVIVPFDDFSGLRMINVGNLPEDTMMCLGFDGIGTKVEIGERVGEHKGMAFDLLAMVCDDAVVRGGEPVLVGSILDVNNLGKNGEDRRKQLVQLAEGYIQAAKAANVAIINGELAELGGRVKGFGEFNYNWGAGLVWFASKQKLFTGLEIEVGDSVVAFCEKGFRSNGLSLVRKIFNNAHGEDWHAVPFNGSTLGKMALMPSRIYSKAVVDMHGGVGKDAKAVIHGVAHITGGGIPGKLGRVLKASKLGAELTDLFPPSEIMAHCQKLGNVQDEEAYRTWNMGNGMLVITPEPEKVIQIAKQHGIIAKKAGVITAQPRIAINNLGAFASAKSQLIFELS